ncbi:MAG: preprotein translocase subunit YajC [Microthrixaceae bacterium]
MDPIALLAQESSSGGSPLGILILILPMAAIVALMILPQRRQRKKQADLMSAIDVGDEVVTIGGMHGVVNHIEGDEVHLEVDDDVVIKFSLGAVSRMASDPDAAASKPSGGILGALTGGGQGAGTGKGGGGTSEGGDDGDASDSGRNGDD